MEAVNEVALRAAAVVLEGYRAGDAWVRAKADGSPVTAVDLAADAIIREGLTALDPAIPYLSEEHEIPPYEVRRGWSRYWLVDPLDGTKEFVDRTGEFTVNVALIEDGEPVLGVVVAPAAGVLYYARAGEGAWKREGDGPPRRLRSTLSSPSDPLRVVESRSHPSAALEAFLEPLNVVERVKSGSSLKFCVVAEGRADALPAARADHGVGRRRRRLRPPPLRPPRPSSGHPALQQAVAAKRELRGRAQARDVHFARRPGSEAMTGSPLQPLFFAICAGSRWEDQNATMAGSRPCS